MLNTGPTEKKENWGDGFENITVFYFGDTGLFLAQVQDAWQLHFLPNGSSEVPPDESNRESNRLKFAYGFYCLISWLQQYRCDITELQLNGTLHALCFLGNTVFQEQDPKFPFFSYSSRPDELGDYYGIIRVDRLLEIIKYDNSADFWQRIQYFAQMYYNNIFKV